MERLIYNVGYITGDGLTHEHKGWLLIRDGLIEDFGPGDAPAELLGRGGVERVDAPDGLLIPGLINAHTHGCTAGPLFSSGSLPLSDRQALRNLDRHLLQGTTTVINVCGLGTPEETCRIAEQHPVNLYTGTSHLPASLAAAELLDGKGLHPIHTALTAAFMLEHGAVLIGEVGSGATLGGGVSDYLLIPRAIRSFSGVEIDREQAGSIKKTVYRLRAADRGQRLEALRETLAALQLDQSIAPERCLDAVEEIVIKPLGIALQGYAESARLGVETGVPVVFHHAAPSAAKILELAHLYRREPRTFVAAHCNHPSFSLEESLRWARELRKADLIIDVSTLNSLNAWRQDALDNAEALVAEGLADTLSTDYGGGRWDGILTVIQFLWKRKKLALPVGIAMATGRVAELYPRAAARRGYLRKGYVADLTLVDCQNVGMVEQVFCAGLPVVNGGWCCYEHA